LARVSRHSKGGPEYATLSALAYRQAYAATKLVWVPSRNITLNMFKEISTNGDFQTMDVIFPSSPVYLYTNPDLLKLLLLPVLIFANSETHTPFGNPYSPHQIGTYPIADADTAAQEPMPMENTGNMFLMLAGIVKFDANHDYGFFYPRFWPLLKSWADYLVATLPFPAEQICTDDFTGPLKNNSNLAVKGIVALEAFAWLCTQVKESGCDYYSRVAANFAVTWIEYSFEESPAPHFKLAYDYPNSWSLKYNLLWQKLLNLSGPFPYDSVVSVEIPYYLQQKNLYGTPMDVRHTYVLMDWLTWASVMTSNESDFHALFDPMFLMINTTISRAPFPDLYDTTTAVITYHGAFIYSAVIGSFYAKMLV